MNKKRKATRGEGRVSGSLLASRCVCLLLFLFFGFPLFAHEVRPAYLELHQTGSETYDILWKVPGQGDDLRLGLYVQLPESCSNVTQPRGAFAANAYTERWSVQCGGGLSGATIRIAGLSATLTDVLVRIERVDGSTQITRLTPAISSFVVEAAPSRMEIVRTYLVLGIEHILTGVDHLLFVLGLLLLVRGFGRLVKTVSAFTVAHSVTLALATLGFVHVPSPPVEAVIALSIVFVAKEILRSRGRSASTQPSLTERQPWLVAFSFGLIAWAGIRGRIERSGIAARTHPARAAAVQYRRRGRPFRFHRRGVRIHGARSPSAAPDVFVASGAASIRRAPTAAAVRDWRHGHVLAD